jgi:glycosyltransferase involved in cell wall biosynthesis
MNVLYITYDGLTDFIGQSQVFPYLLGCAEGGHALTVISFEKPSRMERFGAAVKRQCAAARIDWRPQRFRSSPALLAKAIDLAAMRHAAKSAARSGSFDLVHCRSYPAASVGLRLKRELGLPLLFDMRGFWPDQRREGGRWRADRPLGRALYRHWKSLEAKLLADADHVVTLTAAARDVVTASPDYGGAPVSVIPCCADFDLFALPSADARAAARAELSIPADAPVLVYLGSLGTVYRLDGILGIFAAARQHLQGLKLVFIGGGGSDMLFAEARRLGIRLSPEDVRCFAAERTEVPHWLGVGDVGLCLCTPSFSSLGVSPSKVGEYLACGLPVIGNEPIGDFARIVEAVGAGHVLQDLGPDSIARAGESVAGLLRADRAKVRERARRFLDLEKGVGGYRRIYDDPRSPVVIAP